MDEQTLARVRNAIADPRIGPETIAFMLTGVCNLGCVYCRGGRRDPTQTARHMPGDELTTDEIFTFLEDARSFQVKEINLGGMDGEPLCKKDALKIVRRIKALGFMGSMTTNGSFLDPGVAKTLTECGWDIMLLSLDSADPDIHHALRPSVDGKPYFANIVRFLDALNALDSRLRILLNVVMTQRNYVTLPELVRFANRYKNIESINVLRLLDYGQKDYGSLQLTSRDEESLRRILHSLEGSKKLAYTGDWLDAGEVPGGTGREGKAVAKEATGKCFTNYYILSIDANGDILQCPQFQNAVGGMNIKRARLKDLWLGEHLRFRQGLKERAVCFPVCCTILKEQNKMFLKACTGGETA